ncbi:MAG: protein kinase [Acidobacteriota bacterium]
MEEGPEKLGVYEIRGRLGSGGMGVVYRAWDARLNRNVAIKTLWPELAMESEARERFLREARAAAAISHPNVTQIYDIGEDGGDVFFAMELVEGRSVEQILREEKQLPVGFALSLIRQASTGLKAAAERGIVHRDIKPANLVLTDDGVLKITDFGLAKQPAGDSNLTTAGLILGTPHYLSPEQATGKPADVRSDIYSLGATLYEMLTGRPPFTGDNAVAVILKHVHEPVPLPASLRPGLPIAVVQFMSRLLAKRPEARPQNHDELLARLDQITAVCSRTMPLSAAPAAGTAPAAARPASGPRSTPVPAAPARQRSIGSTLLLAAFVVLGGLVTWGLVKEMLPDKATLPAGASAPAGVDAVGPSAGPDPSGSRPATVGRDILPPPGGRRAGRLGRGLLRRLTGTGMADLSILRRDHEITETGRLRIFGEVKNNGDGRATGSRVKITVTDTSGKELNSIVVPIRPPRLEPGESGEFDLDFPDPAASVHIDMELNWVS